MVCLGHLTPRALSPNSPCLRLPDTFPVRATTVRAALPTGGGRAPHLKATWIVGQSEMSRQSHRNHLLEQNSKISICRLSGVW